MILAVASGKGGTGKTTLAVNMARVAGGRVTLVDCDVEEPNAHLFLGGRLVRSEEATIPVPVVDPELCDGCGECSKFCEYHAIPLLGEKPMVFPELCHGCGGCRMVCPKKAITEKPHRIGSLDWFDAGGITLLQGKLDVGSAMATPVIRRLRKLARSVPGEVILDAPPGTSCPAVATLQGADVAVLVTEPTPFGLSDLRLAVEVVRRLALPFGVVVNRAGLGDRKVYGYLREEGIPLLAEIPDDRRIAEAYSQGRVLVDALPEYRSVFREIYDAARQLEIAVAEPAGGTRP